MQIVDWCPTFQTDTGNMKDVISATFIRVFSVVWHDDPYEDI